MQSAAVDKRGGGAEQGFGNIGYIGGAAQNDADEGQEGEEEDHLFYDSGRESPTTTAQGSAIVRRRRHRASKATAAWLTQAQTVHPKSSKSTIEKLMSLILEQGETIQHQLSKLRDREVQISQLEEQKHKIREQEHGKNYLLETYLNGLHEAEEKDLTTINSDSGVNTEDTQSPNGGTSPTAALHEEVEGEDNVIVIPSQHQKHPRKSHFAYSERENELLREHLKLKLAPQVATEAATASDKGPGRKSKRSQVANERAEKEEDDDDDDEERQRNMEDEIGVLEKIYVINKHLQREEELLVRLNAKIKRYESENPNLGEDEILDTLNRLNSEIEQRSREIEITNREIELSDRLLNKKSLFLHELGAELDETFGEEAALMTADDGDHDHDTVCTQKTTESQLARLAQMSEGNCFDANPENIYNISKILLKYSDDGGAGGGPETDRDWHHDRVNLAACHRAPINKTDTNKRIIIGNTTTTTTEMGPMSPPSVHHTVTTRVQIHKQPAHNHRQRSSGNDPQSGGGDFIDYHSEQSENHYLRLAHTHLYPSSSSAGLLGCGGGVDATAQANGTDFKPVDLIGMQAHDRIPSESSIGALHPPHPSSAGGHTLAHRGTHCMQVAGISDKVTAINSTRNINSTAMGSKKLATKNFILTSKAYDGLPPVAVAPPVVEVQQQQQEHPQHQLPRCPQADMTQLGTLV